MLRRECLKFIGCLPFFRQEQTIESLCRKYGIKIEKKEFFGKSETVYVSKYEVWRCISISYNGKPIPSNLIESQLELINLWFEANNFEEI